MISPTRFLDAPHMPYQSLLRLKYDTCSALLFGALLLFLGGCDQKKVQRLEIDNQESTPATVRAYPCTVLVVGQESIKESLERQWSARHDSEFSVQTISESDFAATDFQIQQGVDVVVYPAGMMIELIHRGSIVELKPTIYQGDSFNKSDLLKHFRKSGIRYDSKTWAVPCGGVLFGLLYQPDALAITDSELPETWSQLIRWGEKLAARSQENAGQQTRNRQPTPTKIAIPLSKGWAANSFVAVAAAYARQKGRLSVLFERRTMKPLITSESFVRALDEIKALASLNPDCLKMTPEDVLQSLVDGRLAAGITWPTVSVAAVSDNDAVGTLLVSALPGSDRYFDESTQAWGTRARRESRVVNLHGIGSLLASQTKISRRAQSAVEFLNWLPESTISQTLFAQDPLRGPFRVTHLGDVETWIGDDYGLEFETSFASHLKEAHDQTLIMALPSILRQGAYMKILDDEIGDCLKSDLGSKATLEKVAKSWEALTDSIGRKTQSNILRRNSNF